MNTEEILEIMVAAEKKAAEMMLHAHRILTENKTGARDVVTKYDREIQTYLIATLAGKVPGARFYAEEQQEQGDLLAERLFIIDPIDGTMNFVKGFQHSCISIAYAGRGTVLAAAVYNPYLDEMFTAIKKKGAWLNGAGIRAHGGGLADSVTVFGTSPYAPPVQAETFRLAKLAFDNSLDIRREGSAELDLCSVAAGRAGLYFELSLSLWDYAAGALIAEEAGAICRTTAGEALPYRGEKTGILAGAPQAVREFLRLMETEN